MKTQKHNTYIVIMIALRLLPIRYGEVQMRSTLSGGKLVNEATHAHSLTTMVKGLYRESRLGSIPYGAAGMRLKPLGVFIGMGSWLGSGLWTP